MTDNPYPRAPGQAAPGYRRRAPDVCRQKAVRLTVETVQAVEKRCLEESLATGVDVCFADIMRRGVQMALDAPSPEVVVSPPCGVVATVGGTTCVVCLRHAAEGRTITCGRVAGVEASIHD